MKARFLIAAAIAAATLSVGSAHAITVNDTVYFTIKSDTNPTIKFSLPTSPTPDLSVDGEGFRINSVPISANSAPAGTDDFSFLSADSGGGLADGRFFGIFGISTGSQLYSGPESSPTFIIGVYTGTYDIGIDPNATITVSATATPLPAALPMFAGGFGALGLLAWRRRSKGSAPASA